MTGLPTYLPLTVQYVYMKRSRETDELIFLYFRFVHRYFDQDHGKTTTQKISNALVHSVLIPCFNLRCVIQPFVL